MIHDQLAALQIEEQHREANRRSLARLARNDRPEKVQLTLRQRIDRSRRRLWPAA